MGDLEGVGETWWLRDSFGMFCCAVILLEAVPTFPPFLMAFPTASMELARGTVPGAGELGLGRARGTFLPSRRAAQVPALDSRLLGSRTANLRHPGSFRSTDTELKLGTTSQFVLCLLGTWNCSSLRELACPGFAELLFFQLQQALGCPTTSQCCKSGAVYKQSQINGVHPPPSQVCFLFPRAAAHFCHRLNPLCSAGV